MFTVRPAELALVAETRADLKSGRARDARAAAGIRPSEVARACGVSRQAVSQWECGASSPSGDHALAYGRILRRITLRVGGAPATVGDTLPA
jgi:transcriptional regulator with XRE-family HTH domain